MLSAALAMERGWAINLGGGMHHASADAGGGWCPYADIALAMRRLYKASGGAVSRFMVIDLDVHQGNGVERCKQQFAAEGGGEEVFIVDVFNAVQYPWDKQAMQVGTGGQGGGCWGAAGRVAGHAQQRLRAGTGAWQSFLMGGWGSPRHQLLTVGCLHMCTAYAVPACLPSSLAPCLATCRPLMSSVSCATMRVTSRTWRQYVVPWRRPLTGFSHSWSSTMLVPTY